MAIKDKDGNVYKLRGPNPLMKDQREWDKSKTKFINFGQTTEVVTDARQPNVVTFNEESAEEAITIPSAQFLEEIQEEEPVIAEPPTPVEVPPDNDQLAKLLTERGQEFHCVPATGMRECRDELYGYVKQAVVYGQKFTLRIVILDENDLQIQFWSPQKIAAKSVILRKLKAGGERWWRITDLEPKSGGFLETGVPSDVSPSFA